MIAAILAVTIILLIVLGGVVYFTRAEISEAARTDAKLRDPRVPKVAYPLPNGVDPVTISTPLRHAGFESTPDRVDDRECLVIMCGPEDRERVREIIAGAHEHPTGDFDVRSDRVTFVDER